MDLTLRVGLMALLGSGAWHQAGPAASSSVSITKERTQECKAAMERIIKEAQKGADANFDSGDKRLMEYCRQATLARDALTVSRAPARAKGIERQVLLAVREAAARIVTKLNELGPKADYAREDIRLLDKFAVAISAVDCLASAATCPRAEAKRAIAEFNEKAGQASFNGADERALREFHERKAKPK